MFEIDLTQYRVVDLSFTVVPGENGDRPFVVRPLPLDVTGN